MRVAIKDILCGVEKTILTLPEEIRQETVRIVNGCRQPKDNLTAAERRAIRSLKANETLIVLLADKGNTAPLLGTSHFNQKLASLLQDKAYMKLENDPTDSIDHKTVLLLMKIPFEVEVCQQLRPQGFCPPRLNRLPKIHKLGVPLWLTVSTTGSLTYRLAQHLAGLLSYHTDHSPLHKNNSM
jgi:hypothetical protein